MGFMQGKHISLRALEPEDIDYLYKIENEIGLWILSNTQVPFSRNLLKKYIENAHLDIYEIKQLRLVIEMINYPEAIGLIDLFDYDPYNQRIGVGIVVDTKFQRRGIASDALNVLLKYCFSTLMVNQVYCNILSSNVASIKLFEGLGFSLVGIKKKWTRVVGGFQDELMFQKLSAIIG